jgi:hypothetical protein
MPSTELLSKHMAAGGVWPGVDLTVSTIVLSLAKKAAQEILPARKPK